MEWLNTILQGILLGGLYAMFAAGLSLIFGVMRLVNIAHGDLIVLAAYVALVTTQALGINPLAVARHRRAGDGGRSAMGCSARCSTARSATTCLPPLLVTFGLSVIIQNGLLELFTADSVKLNAGAVEIASIAGRRRARDRRAAAHPVRARGRGDRRPAMAVLPHGARPRLPRHLGRSSRWRSSWASNNAPCVRRSRWRCRSPSSPSPACCSRCAPTSIRRSGRRGSSSASRR